MLIASQTGLTTMVAAANTVAELDRFGALASAGAGDFPMMVRPTEDDLLFEPQYRRLSLQPYVFHHETAAAASAFAEAHGISILPHDAMIEQHQIMVSRELANRLTAAERSEGPKDSRSLSEIYGLDQNDPWDMRTPEQKAKDEEIERRAKSARDAGKMTADSYAGTKEGGAIIVNGIRASTDLDGNIVVHDISAYKSDGTPGLAPYTEIASGNFHILAHAAAVADVLTALRITPTCLQADVHDPEITVLSVDGLRAASLVHAYLEFHGIGFVAAAMVPSDHGLCEAPLEPNMELAQFVSESDKIGIYHRIDFGRLSLAVVLRLLKEHDVSLELLDAVGQQPDCAWLVMHPERVAQVAARCIETLYPETEIEVYAVDRLGGRLVPKGVTVLTGEEQRKIGPRPWNEVGPLWTDMDDEQRAEALKEVRWEEFVFCGRHVNLRFGTLVFISPYSFVEEHDEAYAERFEPLIKALPTDFEEIDPGVFRTRNRDFLAVSEHMSKMGIGESLELQLILNRRRHLYFD